MGKTRNLSKKIRATKGTFHAKMGSIKDRNSTDLTEAEDIKKRWQEYTELSHVRLFVTPWTIAYQALSSMGFCRQEYYSGLPFPSPGDLPNTGTEPRSPTLQSDTLPSDPPGKSKYTDELYKKGLHDPDNHDVVITHLELDILECEVKWAVGSISTNKASGGDGIPVKLFQILKDDGVKVLHSYVRKSGKHSSGHRTGKIQFSFQCQRMLKLLNNCTHLTLQQSNAQNSPSQASTVFQKI